MELTNLPNNYADWLVSRNEHLDNDLAYSPLTEDLFQKYKQHLGAFRYKILLQVQKLLVPKQVYVLMKFSKPKYFKTVLYLYRRVKHLTLFKEIKFRLLPVKYQETLRTFERR